MNYGSLNNLISSQSTKGQPKPTIGLVLTVLHWTDRSTGQIVRVSDSGKTFWFTDDVITRTDNNGFSECQTYSYENNGTGPQTRVSLRKNGQWKTSSGNVIQLGYRRAYHDFSF